MFQPLFLVFSKSFVGQHVRRLKSGKVVTVGPYYDKRTRKGMEHAHAQHGHDLAALSDEQKALFERMHKEQHLLHHYHGHALRKRIAEHAEAIKTLTETAKAHRAAGKEMEATQAVNRALKRKSDLLRHQKELAEVDAKVAGIGAMMGKMAPGAGQVQESTEDSHKQYVDKMGSRWKASPRSPAKVTIPPAVEQSLMRLLGGFRSYAEGLERARATDQQFNGDGRYANEYAQNNKDRLEASEAFLAAKLGSIVNAANRAAAEEFIAKHRPDTNLTAHEQGFFGAKPADKKDYEVNSGGDRSGVGSASGGISAAAGRKDETILAPSPSASDDSSIAQAVGSGKDSAPQEGEVNAEGLVFRGGRWHRDGAGQKPEAAKTQQSTPAGDDSLDPNSPNYRYRDTGVIEGARKFNVTEAFREAARKGQLVRYQNIDWGDLEENPRRAKELITKSNLFGKVDWDSLKEQGMEPGAGFLIDRVYASIASAPEDSPERRKDYALGIGSLRDRLETCKTPDEVKKTLSEMGDEFKGEILSARESEEYKAAYSRYQEIMGRVRAVDKQSDALYEPVKEMLNELRTLTYERDKRARRGWKPDPDSAAKIAEITQRMEAAEKRFRDFRAENASYLDNKHRELGNGRYTYASDVEFEARHALDHANSILRLAALRNMQSNPTTRAWVSFGPKFQQIIQGRNDTFNGHRANVRSGGVSDWSWAEKPETAPRATKKGAQFQLLVADKIERVGGKDVLSASTEELKAQFGLRDVQSGNWVLKDIGSAQWHVQRATEAFSDLADLVGADPKQVAMNGRLALAFGARGTGNAGYGGAARAHYEPVDRIINITKMQGGGSLSHEWFHALDNLIGDLHGKQGGAIQFSSEEPDGLPAGLKEAFTGLTQTMMSGEHRMQQRVIVTDADRDLAKRYFDRPTSSMSRNIVAAGGLLGAIQAIDRHQGARQESLARFGKKLPPSERKTYDRYRLLAAAHYGPADATTVSIPSGAPMSSFALEAAKLDQGKTKSYWGTPKELAARAFSAWCEDRLRAQGRKNDYLSSHADNKFYQDPIFGDAKPFPEGEERTRINAAFDRLFAAMAESNTFAKALAMLESEQSRVLFFKSYVPAHTRHLKNGVEGWQRQGSMAGIAEAAQRKSAANE